MHAIVLVLLGTLAAAEEKPMAAWSAFGSFDPGGSYRSLGGGLEAGPIEASVGGYDFPDAEPRAGVSVRYRIPIGRNTYGVRYHSGLGPADRRPVLFAAQGEHPVGPVSLQWETGKVSHGAGEDKLHAFHAKVGAEAELRDDVTVRAAVSRSLFDGGRDVLRFREPVLAMEELHGGPALEGVEAFPAWALSAGVMVEPSEGVELEAEYANLRKATGGSDHAVSVGASFPLVEEHRWGVSHQTYLASGEPAARAVYLSLDLNSQAR